MERVQTRNLWLIRLTDLSLSCEGLQGAAAERRAGCRDERAVGGSDLHPA